MKHNARHSIVKAAFEALEGRTYMSASVGLTNGVLTVQADANTASHLVVEYTADHNFVQAYSAGSDGGLTKQTFALSDVKSIKMVGSTGDDWIYVDPRLGTPANIQGGAGNDTIKGGTGVDTIDGGDGNDLIYGQGLLSTGAGNDTIWASGQNDTLVGGSGNDLLIGGSGNNVIYGGSGNSILIAGQGDDQLIAGTGNHVLYGSNGQDTLIDGTGNDTIYGGAGPNTIYQQNPDTQVHALQGNTVVAGAPTDSPTPTPVQTPPVVSPPVLTPPVASPPVVNPPIVSTDPTPVPPAPTTGPTTNPASPPPPASGPSAPGAVIGLMESTVLAGEGVNANGLDSVLHNGTAVNATYQWNFGDPNGAHNVLSGFNAAHVYDNPGTYTVTLTVTDDTGLTSSATAQVTVNPDNRPIIYVDTNGSDANTGSSPDQAVKTAAHAFQLAGSNTKIEFRRGETFAVNTTLQLNGHDMSVGAYGTGANPVLMRGSGDGGFTIFCGAQTQNNAIRGITFDSPDVAVNGVAPHILETGIWAAGTDLVVRDCTFLNVDYAVDGAAQPHGVVVMDNSAPLVTGIRGYLCWVDGTDWTIVGNYVANSTREHVVRSSSTVTTRVEISDNNFNKVMRAEDPAETYKTTINFRGGTYIYVADNTLTGGSVSFGPDAMMDANAEAAWIVLDGNHINGQLQLLGNTHHVMVRDNLLNWTGSSNIDLRLNDPVYSNRHLSDITITQNTGVNSGTAGQFAGVWGDGVSGQITMTKNLYLAPNDQMGWNTNAAVAVYNMSDLSMFSGISDNIWTYGTNGGVKGTLAYISGSSFPNGYAGLTQWNALSQVNNDQAADPALANGTYTITLNGVTAGAAGYSLAA